MKKFLDFSHLRCPMAFVMCKQALLKLEPGQVLYVQLADAASISDILNWSQGQYLHYQQNQTDAGIVLEFVRISYIS